MDLNPRVLRYLLTVVDEGHFGRAADRLFISNPTLSQQIRKLERQLGVTLLDRTRHPVVPTEVGAEFIRHARGSLEAGDRAVAATARYRRRSTRHIRIGFVGPVAGPLTRPILDGFAEAEPGARLELVEVPQRHLLPAVRQGRIDASFLRPPVGDPDGRIRLDPVLTEPRVALMPARHRLAAREQLRIADLRDLPHIAFAQVDPAWMRWWAVDPRPDGTPVRYGPEVRTLEEQLEAVASGLGIAINPISVAAAHPRTDVVHRIITDIEPSQMLLCTRRNDTAPLVQRLRELTLKIAAC